MKTCQEFISLHLFKWRWWLSAIWANKIDYWIFCEMLSFHGPIMNLKVSRHPVISISLFHENIWISKSHFRLFTHRIRSSKEHELREISKILFSWLEPVISCPCCLVDYVMSHVKISLNSPESMLYNLNLLHVYGIWNISSDQRRWRCEA